MKPSPSGSAHVTVALANEQALHAFAAELANALDPGDVVTLSGDLGSGKTTLARALIRHLAGDPTLEVPSPTFTLMQSYDLPRFTLVHADLYRVSQPGELVELGFEDLAREAVMLVEWPERAPEMIPADRIEVTLTLDPRKGFEHRELSLTGHGTLATRVERLPKIAQFIAKAGLGDARRERLPGDASTRSYERLTLGGRPVLLMNVPRRPDGPPIRYGRTYSAIAHLAEDVKPFIAMDEALRTLGFSAPEIYAADLDDGFLLLEDLGPEPVVADGAPVPERYRAAVDVLVALHARNLPADLPVTARLTHTIPPYDLDAFTVEIELLLDWYLPKVSRAPSSTARSAFMSLWREALKPVMAQPRTWVLRDFHSPNLIWLGDREGVARVGLLDFQDAVIGPGAYDLASLLQDARVTVPEALELELMGHYVRSRRAHDPSFDAGEFTMVYATLAAQRASKVLGIFARLERRDGKPGYIRHMPRVAAYLQRALSHPSLAALKAWYNAYVPVPPILPN